MTEYMGDAIYKWERHYISKDCDRMTCRRPIGGYGECALGYWFKDVDVAVFVKYLDSGAWAKYEFCGSEHPGDAPAVFKTFRGAKQIRPEDYAMLDEKLSKALREAVES